MKSDPDSEIPAADSTRVKAWLQSRQLMLVPFPEERSYSTISSRCTMEKQREEMHYRGFAALCDRETSRPKVRDLLARADLYFLLAYTFSGVMNECFREPANRRPGGDRWSHNPSMALSHFFESAMSCGDGDSFVTLCGVHLSPADLESFEPAKNVLAAWEALKAKTPDVPWSRDYQSLEKHPIAWHEMLPVLKTAKDDAAQHMADLLW
jgi:hypothetical protein